MNPDSAQIKAWKEQYQEVFIAELGSDDCIFRALNLGEYRSLILEEASLSSAEIEEAVVETALLYPSAIDADNLPAGAISMLAEEVLRVSGFSDPRTAKETLDSQRETIKADAMAYMMAFVIAAMPSYTEETLSKLTFMQLMHKVALAEEILYIQQTVMAGEKVTLELIDPQEEAQKEELAKQRHAMTKKPGQAGLDDPIAKKLRDAIGG